MWPFPKKRDFLKMLSDQAARTEEGMRALLEFVQDPTSERGKRVEELEEEADELRRLLICDLNLSFVTPIDREDISALSRAIDDMIDYARSTVEEMVLFKMGPNGHFEVLAEALYRASKDITQAVRLMKSHPQVASEHVVRAKGMENFVERHYREALVELFQKTDMVEIFKTREVYRHLSNAADRGDEAADIIGDIIVKTT